MTGRRACDEAVLDRWLQFSLAERYGPPVKTPLPDEIVRLLELPRAA